jgi:hypothetical protein
MSSRIENRAAPGELLKRPVKRDAAYLAAIRTLPCLVCGGLSEAAHLRLGSLAGIGKKPSDRNVTPLCHHHHMQQHAIGERAFWAELKLDPEEIIAGLNEAYPDIEKMHAFLLMNRGVRR